MKTPLILLTTLALASIPAIANPGAGHGDPLMPIGNLDVSSSRVRTGTSPRLTWEITYPTTTRDIVDITPSGTILPKEEVRVQVRVAGVAFQSGSTELPVAFWTSVTGQSWRQQFFGTGSEVEADEVVFEQIIGPGESLDFAGRARRSSGSWYDIRWTAQQDTAVTGLVNGDPVPDYAPAYQQGEIEDFLSAYVGPDENEEPVATIGPRDLIYLFELASRDPGDWWFDMQDLVVIATFEPTSE